MSLDPIIKHARFGVQLSHHPVNLGGIDLIEVRPYTVGDFFALQELACDIFGEDYPLSAQEDHAVKLTRGSR